MHHLYCPIKPPGTRQSAPHQSHLQEETEALWLLTTGSEANTVERGPGVRRGEGAVRGGWNELSPLFGPSDFQARVSTWAFISPSHLSLSAGARGQGWTLTLCVRDGAGDGGAGGGDGAQGGAHAVGREGASHGCSVGDPGCRVDGSDGLACKGG